MKNAKNAHEIITNFEKALSLIWDRARKETEAIIQATSENKKR